jgi:hypothetical protein
MRFYISAHLPIDDIKRCAFMDFGKKLRNYKHVVKKSLLIKEDDTKESILQSTQHFGQVNPAELESAIDIWMTQKNKACHL